MPIPANTRRSSPVMDTGKAGGMSESGKLIPPLSWDSSERPEIPGNVTSSMKAESQSEQARRTRGPRNMRPGMLRFASFLHLMCRILFFTVLVGIPLSILFFGNDWVFMVILPGVLLATWILWLFTASKVGCRICAMRMLLNKKCAKSKKAPSWPILGPHSTMAVLALCTNSVRCPYCGTPNDLTPAPKK